MEANLDLLATQIERATSALGKLREENRRLADRIRELEAKRGEGEKSLNGKKLAEVLVELETLRAAERTWTTERKEVAGRIEDMVRKLERLES
jgi:chromosome segregation ATPase